MVILTTIPLVLWKTFPSAPEFDHCLKQISTGTDINGALNAAESFVRFQESGLMAEGKNASAVADFYFRLGESLLAQPDNRYLERAKRLLEKSIEIHPGLRHGWQYYQLGQVCERLGEAYWERAREVYLDVYKYDYGNLASSTGYRIALLDYRTDKIVRESDYLYKYIRYTSRDPEADLQPFKDTGWYLSSEETLYLKARLAYLQNKSGEAKNYLDEYLMKRPDDYSAQYYYDLYSGTPLSSLYPKDGNLLEFCYAPRSMRNGHFQLLNGGELFADLYLAFPMKDDLVFDLDYTNPFQVSTTFTLSIDEQAQVKTVPPKLQGKLSFRFPAQNQKNRIHLFIKMDTDETLSIETPWIQLNALRVSRSEPVNPS